MRGVDILRHVELEDAAAGPDEHAPTSRLDDSDSARSGDAWFRGAGDSFPGRASRSAARVDEGRLREAFAQLGRGLAVLHAAGKVHRDVKPSNVLVTAEGRVVLLDFGLVTESRRGREHTDLRPMGTADYMAPEQASGAAVEAASDWYALGVMLYRALTGRLPFDGPAVEVLVRKQRVEPAPPRLVLSAVPDDLDALCVELLRIDPAARPPERDILRRLGVTEDAIAPVETEPEAAASASLVGREPELAALERALDETRKRRAVTVVLGGEPGVGKSTLVRAFVERAIARDPTTVVLAGRCHEHEAVPYKAIDGVVDALSRTLRRLPEADAAALLPRHAALLAQVFPVLGRVEPVARAPRLLETLDPKELRGHVFLALRELLVRLADRRPVIAVIDDLQWTDADSLALLRALLRPPDAPSLLFLATLREGGQDVIGELEGEVRQVSLGNLDEAHAVALAAHLLGRVAASGPISAEEIARESGGHPLFIDELVRHAVLLGEHAGALQLEDALGARISRLERARAIFLERCSGTAWELDSTQMFLLVCLLYLGRLAELTRRTRDHLREAVERGDLYATTNMRNRLVMAWLVTGETAAARVEAAACMRRWSHEGFHLQHYRAPPRPSGSRRGGERSRHPCSCGSRSSTSSDSHRNGPAWTSTLFAVIVPPLALVVACSDVARRALAPAVVRTGPSSAITAARPASAKPSLFASGDPVASPFCTAIATSSLGRWIPTSMPASLEARGSNPIGWRCAAV